MRAKKRLFPLLTFCLSITCAFAFIACEQDDNTSDGSILEESSFASMEESSIEDSSSDETPMLPEKMSESEWQAAFSAESFTNCTIHSTTATQDVVTETFTLKRDGAKLYQRFEGELQYEMYYSLENETVYAYMDYAGGGKFTKVDISTLYPDYTPTLEELAITGQLVSAFVSFYNDFIYDAEIDEYTMESEGEAVVLKFENNKLVYYQNTSLDGVNTVTISNYGTTAITLPTVESTADAVGDGIITANEFAAALSPNAFKNVTLSSTMSFENTYYMSVSFDESENIKVEGLIGTTSTMQWWTTTGAYVYDETTQQWVEFWEDAAPWKTADNLRQTLQNFSDLYSLFVFDGYTATYTSTNPETQAVTVIMFTFNEQEQLTGYYGNIGDSSTVYWTFSNYGTVQNVLPF